MPALSTLAHGVRFELKAMLRNPRARFFTLIFPVVMLVVLCGVAGNGTTTQGGEVIKLARFYVPAILALAIVTSCFGALTQSIVTRRHLGVFKRRRTAPVPAWSLVLGQSLANTAVALTTVVVLLIAGKAIYGIGLATPGLVAVALTIVLGAICFCAVAFAVWSVIPSPDAAQPIVQALLLPLYFISGIWLPMAPRECATPGVRARHAGGRDLDARPRRAGGVDGGCRDRRDPPVLVAARAGDRLAH